MPTGGKRGLETQLIHDPLIRLKMRQIDEILALRFVGKGTPENNVVAPPGAVYQRTDGGAGTSFYVKESGTGKTGWVGK